MKSPLAALPYAHCNTNVASAYLHVVNKADPNDPGLTQFKNMLAWDVASGEPDPGQAVSLRKYIPVDLLQVCWVVALRISPILGTCELISCCVCRSHRKRTHELKQ